jgi:4-hydroxybenzoyl-CoA reductase alpha subunit
MQRTQQGGAVTDKGYTIIGKNVPRIDAITKVTGEAKYTCDLKLPAMLWGKILRSPYPHARILNIDTNKAERLIGVRAVITSRDVPKTRFSFVQTLADKQVLCHDKARYMGDEIAAVAAIDPETAEEALELIRVDYEELPAVFDPEEAMSLPAPRVHEKEGNIAYEFHKSFGDVNRAFDQCEVVCEDRYETPQVAHCCMETSNCIAQFDSNGHLNMYVNTQAPHTQRQELARILGIPEGKIRVINSHMGGGFGSKLVTDMKQAIAACLAMKTSRPVKIVNTRQEEFTTAKTRYPYIVYAKTGVTKDGRILARELKVIGDNGAYNDKGPSTLSFGSIMFNVLYDVPNTRFDGTLVYTNKQSSTAFRGFGNPQFTFATESQLDDLAVRLKMDPLELRLRNLNKSNSRTTTGATITSCGMQECMESAASAIGWKEKRQSPKKHRGIGLANMVHSGAGSRYYGFNSNDAFVKMADDGTVSVITSALDMGQGAQTIMAQIVAEELGVPMEDIRILTNDTDLTPYDLGSWGSRSTFVCGNAVRMAAKEAKRELLEVAGEMLEATPQELVVQNGLISVIGSPDIGISVAEVIRYSVSKKASSVSGKGRFIDKSAAGSDLNEGYASHIPTFCFATQAAEVEVDTETGKVNVLKIVAAHDTGTAINPMSAEGQIEGGVIQGVGFTLMEKLSVKNGRVENSSFLDYKIPTSDDIPEVEAILVETEDPAGPFGGKGIGETGLVPTAPAIANAIFDAIGVRFKELPITPEKILRALKKT